MSKESIPQTNKNIFSAGKKSGVFFRYFIQYLVVILSVFGWTAVILFSEFTLGRPIISGYVLLFILTSFLKEIKAVLFTVTLSLLSYLFLYFAYSQKAVFYPLLDLTILFLSAIAVVLIVKNIQRYYDSLLKERDKTKATKEFLEKMVAIQTKELQEFSGALEIKIKQRTQALEKTRRALVNLLEDAEESKKIIEEERNKTRATLTSLTDGLIVFNKEKKITLVNPEAEKILELKEAQILNQTIDAVSGFPKLDQMYRVLGGEIEWTGQRYELILEEALKRYFQISITPVVVSGEEVGLMVVLRDVTREKEIDSMKTEFVSIAAHQLRTPLSATKWILRMLLDGDVGKLSKEQISFLEKGYQSNERMIFLINDLLNVAHIEEGRFIYEPSYYFLEDVAQKSIDGLKVAAKKRNVEIVFNKPENGLSKKIKMDKGKIGLVIQNLTDNAIRFTKPGGKVTVSIEYDKIKVDVMVKDTGVGIPKEQQHRIFTKFFRADNVVKMETEGTGLGLFICKNIIKAHGGKIWFKSKENEGTAFYFMLPLESKL